MGPGVNDAPTVPRERAGQLPERVPVPSTTIDGLVDGVYPAMALLAALQLDLFSQLLEPAGAAAVARSAGLDLTKTQQLLDAVVAAGLLIKNQGRYALTAESRDHLTRTSPWSRVEGHRVLCTLWSAALHTADSLRSGRAGGSLDYERLDVPEAVDLLRGLRPDAVKLALAMLDKLELRAGDRLVDVGGGSGGAAAAFADAVPGLQATVVELPNIARATRLLIEESGHAQQVRVLASDATTEVPGQYDAAWICLVTQTLAPAAAEALIANAAAALAPGGAMHLLNVVVDPSRHEPARAALFNVALLNLYDGGQAYSTADYERWLRNAGFSALRWHSVNDMIRMVSARRY